MRKSCKIKKQDIKRLLKYARFHVDAYRISSLEQALKNVNIHCNQEK
ncbi:DUF1090 domain-containing protein [Photorhabdus temperata]|nr:DUF1090 domain-containing protein [Photorhabdus temperata]